VWDLVPPASTPTAPSTLTGGEEMLAEKLQEWLKTVLEE
jgi:hypothetical protein